MRSAQDQAERFSADSGMDSLLALMPEIAAAADDVEVGAVIQRRVCEILGAERVTLFLFDHRLLELRPPFHDDAHPDELIVSLKMGLAGYSAILKRPLNVSDAKTEYFFNRELDSITDFNTERLLAAMNGRAA